MQGLRIGVCDPVIIKELKFIITLFPFIKHTKNMSFHLLTKIELYCTAPFLMFEYKLELIL